MQEQAVIRPATPDDGVALRRLNRDALGYDFPLDDTRARLKSILEAGRDYIAVAEWNGAVVGYCHAASCDCTFSPPLKNIWALAVSAEFRKRGVGRALLEAVEQWAKSGGAAGVRLNTNELRAEAHAFYESCGYTSEKTQKNYKKYFAGEGPAGP